VTVSFVAYYCYYPVVQSVIIVRVYMWRWLLHWTRQDPR